MALSSHNLLYLPNKAMLSRRTTSHSASQAINYASQLVKELIASIIILEMLAGTTGCQQLLQALHLIQAKVWQQKISHLINLLVH